MRGAALRATGTWAAATALIVLGVDAAIEQVAADVTITRPAPLTSEEVGRQLRARERVTSTTSTPAAVDDSPVSGSTQPTTSAPGRTPGPGAPNTPDTTRPQSPGGPPADVGTSTTAGEPGRTNEHGEPGGP